MKLHVRCVCSNEIDCERLDMVVSLRCPICDRELTLEYTDPQRQRKRMVLKVLEGPRLLGEEFVIPINEDLVIGGIEGMWLALPAGEVAVEHCKIRIDHQGFAAVTDRGSPSGTWIDQARIVEGYLKPGQDLRVGFYRLRVEIQGVSDAPTATLKAGEGEDEGEIPEQIPLGMMRPLDAAETHATWFVTNRFQLVRYAMLIFAWSVALEYFLILPKQLNMPWYFVAPAALIVGSALTVIAQKVAFVNPRWNAAAFIALAVVALANTSFLMIGPAIAGGLLAAATALMVWDVPSEVNAVGASLMGLASLGTVVFTTLQDVMTRWPRGA